MKNPPIQSSITPTPPSPMSAQDANKVPVDYFGRPLVPLHERRRMVAIKDHTKTRVQKALRREIEMAEEELREAGRMPGERSEL